MSGRKLKCCGKTAGKSCQCSGFYYIIAEGAWVIRCRCKVRYRSSLRHYPMSLPTVLTPMQHKHIEHDCSKKPHKCTKTNCKCGGFDSPFVCNCDHGWAKHKQVGRAELCTC